MKKTLFMLMAVGAFMFTSCDTTTENTEEGIEEAEYETEEIGTEIEEGTEELGAEIEEEEAEVEREVE